MTSFENEQMRWANQRTEEVIDPRRPIIDPHHHLWVDHGRLGAYTVAHLNADTAAGHNIVGTVFVECMSGYYEDGPEELRPVGETAFVADSARQLVDTGGAPILGISSFADLTLGDDVQPVLEAHEAAGAGLFRGIRHAVAWHKSDQIPNGHTNAPEHLMYDSGYRQGFQKLGEMGYVFDAWLMHPQLPDLAALCEAHPDTPVVLDHIGAPMGIGPYAGKRAEVIAEWRPHMAKLAESTNVSVKIGGIGMARYGAGWEKNPLPPSSEELADYWGDELRFCIDTFGPSRCMFESNFPVDRSSCNYVTLWNALKIVGAGYSDSEQDELFFGTANRFYSLGL